MWKDNTQISLEKYMSFKSLDASYCWLSNKDILKELSLKPIDHLKSEEKVRRQNITYIIYNERLICPNGHLHPLKYSMENVFLLCCTIT